MRVEPVTPIPSLFVVSLPRSYSGLVHFMARRHLALREPRWTTDGEVLNLDRYVHLRGPRWGSSEAFTTRGDSDLFDRMTHLLDEVVQPAGYVYKEVTQPFVLAAWLPSTSLRVVKIVRPVPDVAYAMLARGWDYPRVAAAPSSRGDAAVVEGLLRAEAALATVPGVTLSYDDMVAGEGALAGVFEELYPDAHVGPVRYIDDAFAHERYRQFARRATPRYKALAALADRLRDGSE